MEIKKNWKDILNNWIISVSLILATLLISMCFITPRISANASVNQSQINSYNINFVAAKTKVRTANGLKKSTLYEQQGESITAPEFDTYQYNYSSYTDSKLYYGTTNEIATLSSSTNHVEQTLFTAFDSSNLIYDRQYGFIPYGVNYYDNLNGEKEEVFYNNINTGDFVLIDNYYSPTNSNFHVENFYLGFGSPYIDEKTTTPLASLRVEGKLYSEGREHYLALNTPETSEIIKNSEENLKVNAYYWNQYFDLKNLQAYETADPGSPVYSIENQEGRYELKFYFIRYNSDFEPVAETPEQFTFTFYLLDGVTYSDYPTINNADILDNSLSTNEVNEYYYNFNNDAPFVKYDPTKYNITYTRSNSQITTQTISSRFVETTYTIDGIKYPLGIITYFNGSKAVKQVYILTYYNSDKTFVEYMYLSKENPLSSEDYYSTYTEYKNAINKGLIKFEYKTSIERLLTTTSLTNTYTTTTYRTESFDKYEFILDTTQDISTLTDKTVDSYSIIEEITIISDSKSKKVYKLDSTPSITNDTPTTIATLTTNSDNEDSITIPAGINLEQISNIINPDTIRIEYDYELVLDNLGIYNFTYSYISPADSNKYFINSTNESTTIMPYSNSTNYTTPVDFAVPTVVVDNSSTPTKDLTTKDLYYVVSSDLGVDIINQAVINGITFEYKPSTNQIYVNGTNYDIEREVNFSPFEGIENTIFSIKTVAGKFKLTIKYAIGKIVETSSYTNFANASLNGKSNYRQYEDTIVTTTYSIASNLEIPNTTEWTDFKNTILALESYTNSKQIVKNSTVNETVQGKDRLHIFGSITYFNKTDNNTDSGYAKLEQVDKRLNLNYISDVTSLYLTNPIIKDNGDGSTTTINPLARNISKTDAVASRFQGVASLLTKDNIIITDVTPILWNNFSNLLFDNKQSKSYIYRYTDYSFNSDGTINYGNKVYTSTYQKDNYCQFDGLYEIVVFYTYTNASSDLGDNNVFYQVFTFIIDNSSPSLIIEVENEDGTYEELGLNKYTNKNVRLSWEVPTYFKNDVYIEINKTYYNTTNNQFNFNSIYKQNTITTKSGANTYVQSISAMTTYRRSVKINDSTSIQRDFYGVELKLQPNADVNYNTNGNYKIIMHYNAEGKSTFTEEFVIDKIAISGLNIQRVVKNEDGSYGISKGETFGSNQIVNSDFTFRFNRKDSGANIYVYFDKIDFISNDNYDSIINTSSDLQGITTKYMANGDKISIGTQYIYNYTHESNMAFVETNNLLTSNNSSIFLFRLVDEAGNECRYVVFYDKTEPRFVMSPEPDSLTHYATDTTRLFWGDYKAIKVHSSQELTIDNLNVKVDNYSKDTETDKLKLILRYINTNLNFNNLKVESCSYEINNTTYTDYFILVPITKAEIQDRTYSNTLNISDVNNYYFFPVNPIEYVDTNANGKFDIDSGESGTLTLPKFNQDGTVVIDDNTNKTVKETYTVADFEITTAKSIQTGGYIERYISITYYLDDSKTTTNTIRGVFGNGNDINNTENQIKDSDNTHTYLYNIYDGLSNKTSGAVTVTTDLTETIALGLFDYTDNVNKAIFLEEDNTTYSASQLFVSSKVGDEIPAYTLTYQYFAYDISLYTDYNIQDITLINSFNDNKLKGSESYLQIEMKHKATLTTKTVKVQLTDEDGNAYPLNSYPYSLEGTAIVADTNKNPIDIYTNDGFTYRNNQQNRKYSLALNTTTDTNKRKVVTEEGLYIFKRAYTDETLDKSKLGSDSRIIYKVYYVDRSGIINITTNNSVASKLYDIGSAINFTLGSNYNDTNYQKNIDAKTIQNNQTAVASSTSNANYASNDLFSTNKIEVEFTLSYDKHNFENFVSNYKSSFVNKINTNENRATITNYLNNYLFNINHFSSKIYKTELSINVGGNNTAGTSIIDEKNNYYSKTAMSAYLQGTPMLTETKRSNVFNFYYDASSNFYIININDQAGYIKHNEDNTITNNYLANNLKISFDIEHNAPNGEFYGKYYGRHNYDNNSEVSSNSSIPIENGNYAILSKYLQEGQLEPLSDREQNITHSLNGDYIELYSTNNETMIFTFAITEDEYQAQIDPNNIRIYKGTRDSAGLIFNLVDGINYDTKLVSANRQKNSFTWNEINGIKHYAIIIFDNNLDEILDKDEISLYGDYRLLDAKDNPDKETYYIEINYLGNKNDYIGEDALGNKLSFYNSTYEIVVDRIKPTYNLTKLMSLDKYTYNTISTPVTSSNYESVFDQYNSVYNFVYDDSHDFYRSDLENYFFALDCRENSSFIFESIDNLDNNKSLYIRMVDKNNYKFSVTPDDYKAYYNAVYLQGHPQFTPSTAKVITNDTFGVNSTLELNKYYRVQFTLDGDSNDNCISAYYLLNRGIFKANNYYEIIEEDATGNYRVYAVYIPQQASNKIVYTYQENNNINSLKEISIINGNTPYVTSQGMNLKFTTINFKDNFLRTNIVIKTNKITHSIDVILDPNKLTITATNRTTGTIMAQQQFGSKDKGSYTNTDAFIEVINYILQYYNDLINNKSHEYYSEYGYNVDIDIVDRIGVGVKDMKILYNYEIDYVVAGSTLSPIFIDNNSNFTMRLEGQKGSTYLTDITVYKFNKTWTQINVDNSSSPKIFKLTIEELKKPIDYLFTRGIYKFVFTDNFNRTNEFFYEYGISSSQTGGNLKYSGEKITHTDGYTYSADIVEYSYDSTVYNVYIKFIGKIPDEYAEGEYINIPDSKNEIIYNSGSIYSDSYLRQYYGISVITSGNITTITFHGVKDNSTISGTTNLSKYHIKTILASTSDNYTWGDELTNKDIFVYNKQVALYTAIQDINIKNLSGNTLDTSNHLNLTEDFELVSSWKSTISTSERIDFNSRIILTRTYYDNGNIRTTTSKVSSGQIISLPGDYVAYIINDLGMTSRTISFTRGEGEISMYAVYAVDNANNSERKLSPSSLITSYESENKVLFTYYITDDYFNYSDALNGNNITLSNLIDYMSDTEISNKFISNLSANKYIDVRVNSNLSIKTEVFEVGIINNFDYPYVQYRIYSDTMTGDMYTYRFIRIVFVNKLDVNFASTHVASEDDYDNNLTEQNSIITTSTKKLYIEFNFFNEEGRLLTPLGNTIYIDRYYNGNLIETTIFAMSNETQIPVYKLHLTDVGIHEFVIRDLAGRIYLFNNSTKLQIYLINQIIFTVNGESPINNQVFNGTVDVDIIYNLSGLQLYNERTLAITISKDGNETNYDGNVISGAGYYTVKMTANTLLNGGSSAQIVSIYNFIIIDPKIAHRSFSISKSTGFTIKNLVKIVGVDEQNLTDTYETLLKANAEKYGYIPSETLLWFSHAEHGNCIFDVTLEKFNPTINSNQTFNFRIWINDESPIILSSIPEGTSTKDTISINFNPGLIYSQIGKGYITLNDQVIAEINENSQSIVDTISIDKKGTYWFKVYNEDGRLISSYKFVKNDPINNLTKTILICVGIGIVVVVGLFFFLRRKGRYR